MAITGRPKKDTVDTVTKEDSFIDAAPDASLDVSQSDTQIKAAPKRVRKGNKVQISLTLSEAVLNQVDEAASNLGLSRAAVINMAISQSLQQGIKLDL
jgi:predicted DNA binding CopG/RHH family protein